MLDKSILPLKNIVWLIIIFGITVSTWGGSDGVNLHMREQSFHAQRLEVDRFFGRLRIEVEARADLMVQMRGITEDLDGITLNVHNGVLHIENQHSGSASSVTISNVTAVASGGGTASISIGGQNVGAQINRPSVEITVRMPTGIPLGIHGLNGDCQIGNTIAPVELTLFSGNCTLGDITQGELLIQGSGDIMIHQVSGDLRVGVSGSGNIRVNTGLVDHLQATLSGSGDINLGVKAQQAVLSLMGAGHLHVTYVRDRPQITIAGAGTVKVDNW